MENNELHDPWVDRRMAALDPPAQWQPDTVRGFTRFRERQKVYRTQRTRWTWAAIAASVTAAAFFLLTPAPCAGAGCLKTSAPLPPHTAVAVSEPLAPPPVVTTAAAQKPQASKTASARPAPPKPAPPEPLRYKESGNALAPIACELYSDYECPHCAVAFLQTMPSVIKDYVKTGKIRLVHRDFPLPMHPNAKLAARYANAAGMLGHYDAVVNQIFRTQSTWALTGDIGTQVAQVLPPDVMNKVRDMVQNDQHLDDTVTADIAAGMQDQINQTPTLVVVYKGKRQLLAPVPPYELLKSYFDELLTK